MPNICRFSGKRPGFLREPAGEIPKLMLIASAFLFAQVLEVLDWLMEVFGRQWCAVLFVTGQSVALPNPLAEALFRTRALVLERLFWLENSPDKTRHILNSYSKQTFPNTYQTIVYHFKKHGSGLTIYEYTVAALKTFIFKSRDARLLPDRTGQKSWNIKGRIGGWFTQTGKVITFWRRAEIFDFNM